MNNDMKNGEHNDLCVGIDLGTTNSVLATINVKPNGDIVSKVVDIPRPVDIYNTVSGRKRTMNPWWVTLPRFSTLSGLIWWQNPSKARWEGRRRRAFPRMCRTKVRP